MFRNIVKRKCYGVISVMRLQNNKMTNNSSRTFSISILQTPHHVPLTKIVATIGPKSEQLPVLKNVVNAGMKIMRINFSHATYEEANLRSTNITKCLSDAGSRDTNILAVMLDTQGPEIRTGSFDGDLKEVELVAGAPVVLSTDPNLKNKQTLSRIWISYNQLMQTVTPGTSILLDDGAIELLVEKVETGRLEVHCTVLNTGILGNKKGVNIPSKNILLPAMCDKDKEDIKWGVENDIDFIAASFVRKASDVHEIREYVDKLFLKKYGTKDWGHYNRIKIISKIESTEALKNFHSILEVSDAIMVARGDLGVEIPLECIANVQKEIVRQCNRVGKPVIVATQMLESMQKNPRPTRAESTDVYNAVLDGADCVMLSGESAKGKYPVQSVATMNRIVAQAEAWVNKFKHDSSIVHIKPSSVDLHKSFAYGIVETSKNLHAVCIVCITHHGGTPQLIAKYRPNVPIVTFTPDAKTARLLQINRAIYPVVTPIGVDLTCDSKLSVNERYDLAIRYTKDHGFCKSNDHVVIVSSEHASNLISDGVTMRVVKVL